MVFKITINFGYIICPGFQKSIPVPIPGPKIDPGPNADPWLIISYLYNLLWVTYIVHFWRKMKENNKKNFEGN